MAELGSALAETIRSEFDAVFAVAGEPALSELTERTASPGLGAPYRQVPVTGLSGSRDPFSVDPALVERGLRGHTETQNELASVLSNAGIEPRRGLPPGPDFDLAWQKDGTIFVAEVKSITSENEKHQLRVGLGQVLHYRQRLSALGHDRVVAVLVPERQPGDPSWRELCQELGVVLLCRNESNARLGWIYRSARVPSSTMTSAVLPGMGQADLERRVGLLPVPGRHRDRRAGPVQSGSGSWTHEPAV